MLAAVAELKCRVGSSMWVSADAFPHDPKGGEAYCVVVTRWPRRPDPLCEPNTNRCWATSCIHRCSSRINKATGCSWPPGGLWCLGFWSFAAGSMMYTKTLRETPQKAKTFTPKPPRRPRTSCSPVCPRRELVYTSRRPQVELSERVLVGLLRDAVLVPEDSVGARGRVCIDAYHEESDIWPS